MHTRKQFVKFTELSKYTMVDLKINYKLHQALQQGKIPPLGITELKTKPLTESWMKPQGIGLVSPPGPKNNSKNIGQQSQLLIVS